MMRSSLVLAPQIVAAASTLTLLAAIPCAYGLLPVPTPDQLLFQYMETGALVCYNMATTTGTQGCPAHSAPPVSAFNDVAPADINTDQWCQAIASFGGKYATIVAKHNCGFAIWPTQASLSNRNFSYTYSVPQDKDLVMRFSESCAPLGVRLGVYYSVVSNEYLNVAGGVVRDPSTLQPGQVMVSQQEYNDLVVQQLTELWSQYGALAEIWFDGGFQVPGLQHRLLALLNSTQPHAAIFNGCGLSPNPVAWIGTESGHAPYPVWNTQTGCPAGAGAPNGTSYVPKEVDLTLQNSDTWFYQEGTGYRSLPEMVGIYHDSVGHGGNMLLNIAPPPNSTLPEAAMRLYSGLGRFVRECYGEGAIAAPSALGSTSGGCSRCMSVQLQLGAPKSFDRVLIKEEISGGQRVRGFSVLVDGVAVFNGTAIGRTLIVLLPSAVVGSTVQLQVNEAAETPSFRLFAVPDPQVCAMHANQTGCATLSDTRYQGPVLSSSLERSVAACCDVCAAEPECAFFTAAPVPAGYNCSILNAQTGSSRDSGVVSGSPR